MVMAPLSLKNNSLSSATLASAKQIFIWDTFWHISKYKIDDYKVRVELRDDRSLFGIVGVVRFGVI